MMETLNDKKFKSKCGWNVIIIEDIKEFIKDIPAGIKECIERGQFNERYFEKWLEERVGDGLI